MSEYGLIRYRIQVECAYLLALGKEKGVPLRLTPKDAALVKKLAKVSPEDAALVKRIETEGLPAQAGHEGIPATRHDVKAVEYLIKERAKGTSLESKLEWVHFGLTSEDVNNISYALMLRDGARVLAATLDGIIARLMKLASEHAELPMLARTHGQPASPTTFGKEMRVFAERLARERAKLGQFEIGAKLNGATGNYHALAAAFPKVDWVAFTERFIGSLGDRGPVKLVPNFFTTQIEPHDSYAELFQLFHRVNSILIGFDQDMWRYVSDGWLVQKPVKGEVGSSTMPHKVNPIDFENSEGNLGIANALFEHFARKLPISRLQRDLTDSTVERNFGAAFAHTLIGYEMLMRGLGKVAVNRAKMLADLDAHPEVIAEALQTILRAEAVEAPYEKLKELTRGRAVSMADFKNFIKGLDVSPVVKKRLMAITPRTYLGLAPKLARMKRPRY
jgi:adenylosuccinate lyase